MRCLHEYGNSAGGVVWEVASAAFETMHAPSVRAARDPWAVITRAVQLTCSAEARTRGLLISTGQARRPARLGVGVHDAVRLSERDGIDTYHPAPRVPDFTTTNDDDLDGARDGGGMSEPVRRVRAAVADTVALFVACGWPETSTRDAVAHVASRLGDLPSRAGAYEVLRREPRIPALLDLPPRSYTSLLRLVLGHPDAKHASTPTGAGVFLRLLTGEPVEALAIDAELTAAIKAAAPPPVTA